MTNNLRILAKVDPRQRAWVEINPAAIESNVQILKNCISNRCLLMAVVKADGYGHGAKTVADAALKGGATHLGIATLQEGIDLRQSGINSPILVLGNLINSEELETCLKWNLMPTLSSFREVLLCQEIAQRHSQTFPFHLKVDTGMSRLGCDVTEAQLLIESIDSCQNLDLKGVYSHLALADEDLEQGKAGVTFEQKNRFESFLKTLPPRKKPICRHLANSAGTLRDKSLHFDMVRVGIALYGYSPISPENLDLPLQSALSVKARVTLIRTVPANTGVSYGHKFVTKRQSRLAVVGIGYADGVSRALSGKISVLINGIKYPQVGAITMDQLVVDVTDNPQVEIGSIVTLLGSDGNDRISPDEWSLASGSILWEILCSFKHRLPRVVV